MPNRETARRKAPQADGLKHSWLVKQWPENIAPGNPVAARAFIRRNRPALIRCGALARVGKDLVVLGAGWAAFLAVSMRNVEGYQCPGNRRLSASGQAGGNGAA
jgi:hypothetical protein